MIKQSAQPNCCISKLRTLLITLILLISSTATAKNESIMKAGETAPFAGVLMGEKTYRNYVISEKEVEGLKKVNLLLAEKFDDCIKNKNEIESEKPSKMTWFLTGALIGLASSFYLESK